MFHTLYEEDAIPLWEQHSRAKDGVREVIYPVLYGRPYKYSSKSANPTGEPPDWDGEEPVPSTRPGEVKPYIPPTSEEDLMKVLGGPMGG